MTSAVDFAEWLALNNSIGIRYHPIFGCATQLSKMPAIGNKEFQVAQDLVDDWNSPAWFIFAALQRFTT